MLVVVEGVNGGGKSTLVTALKEQHDLVELKPFQAFRKGHWGNNGSGDELLRRLRVPFNSPVEDLFIADAVSALSARQSFILDRSLPSGLAYAGTPPSIGADMCRVWLRLLEGVTIVPIVLTVSHETASARLAPERRMMRVRHDQLQDAILHWSYHLFGMPCRIPTGALAPADVLKRANQEIWKCI